MYLQIKKGLIIRDKEKILMEQTSSDGYILNIGR
jgi:hypothetical protein